MNISQNLLQATDNIISQRLGEVSFDRTLVCTVVERKDSSYWVDNGSIRFWADALDGKQYSPNQKVYVTVPEGNYNKRKIIMGGYTESGAFGDKFIVNPYDKTTEMWYADIGDNGSQGETSSSDGKGDIIPGPKLNDKLPSYEGEYVPEAEEKKYSRWVGPPSKPYDLESIGIENAELIQQAYGPLEYFGFDI